MKIIIFISLVISSLVSAKQSPELMLMGTFHFANPGLDVVKSKTINVMTPENQQYLAELSQRISQFKPTMVMLEFNPKNTAKINQEYQQYLNGSFQLPSNEIYQLGFRVAKLSGVVRLESLDETSIAWKAEDLFKHLEIKDKEIDAEMKRALQDSTNSKNKNHKSLSLQDLLRLNNTESYDQLNKNLYFITNSVGVSEGSFVGADSSASWWHRNFRIYAKIQHQAKSQPRIFALAGQGHTAILNDFVTSDQNLKKVDIEF